MHKRTKGVSALGKPLAFAGFHLRLEAACRQMLAFCLERRCVYSMRHPALASVTYDGVR